MMKHRSGGDAPEALLEIFGWRLARVVHEVRNNDFLLRFAVPPYELTVFPDRRTVVKVTRDPQ